MSARIDVGKAGLVLGAVIGGLHLCWSVLVALRWAQPVTDFIFWMHFIKPIMSQGRQFFSLSPQALVF